MFLWGALLWEGTLELEATDLIVMPYLEASVTAMLFHKSFIFLFTTETILSEEYALGERIFFTGALPLSGFSNSTVSDFTS